MMKLSEVFSWVNASQTIGSGAIEIKRVHTDTRSLKAGDLFVALKGDTFDANSFLEQAKALGAVAAIAESGLQASGLAGLEVIDSKLALGELAAAWRTQFELPLIAVTGSNGKTTVTQMVASILKTFKQEKAFATEGNLNNDIGVPLTLLRLTSAHQIGVVELGMNHPGEIGYLATLVRPTVALVNNAQREHLEFMGTVEAVARENGSVIDLLRHDGVAVFPADDAHTNVWRELAGDRKTLTFALDGAADVTGQADWVGDGWRVGVNTPFGEVKFNLQIAGRHNVKNALAAVACALAAGVPLDVIGPGLSAFTPVKGRSRAALLRLHGRDVTLIDDTYNSNPDSMAAAIDLLAELPGPHLLVMGDMGEVGAQGPQFHTDAGRYALSKGIESLFTLGELAGLASQGFVGGQHFDDVDALNAALLAQLKTVGCVLVKGSRFMKMERIVAAILAYEKEAAIKEEPKQKDTSHAA
jgi:UDP-N-acetylmuramoyl-tripeptide--D-alanyl-D-alanine ligase